jgi:hypothetical protein
MSNKTEKVDNLFQEVTSTADNVISKGKKLIRKYLIYVVLLFNIAIQVISKLYQIGLSNPFTVEFILKLIFTAWCPMKCPIPIRCLR